MELLSDRFIMPDDERIMICRMDKFICLFYSIQFLRSRIYPLGWTFFQDHRTPKDFVTQSEVTSDCTERGIKLIGDFRECAQIEKHRKQNLCYLKSKRINTL